MVAGAILTAAAAVLSYTLLCHNYGYSRRLFRSGDGWGYDIGCRNSVVIHQPLIPALPGEMPFPDRKSARKAAGMVIGKLRSGESPALSVEEAESCL